MIGVDAFLYSPRFLYSIFLRPVKPNSKGVFMKRQSAFAVGFVLVCTIAAVPYPSSSSRSLRAESPAGMEEAAVLAQRAFDAHGGKKLKEMSSLLVTGSVEITVSSFQQAIPATFSTAFQGEKYVLDVNSDFAGFRQSFDGQKTVTVPDRGFALPPINRIGVELLKRLGEEGFDVSESGQKNGFRITSPEGYYTDFYPDKKTSLIKSYESAYVVGGRTVTTLVEIKKYEVRDGLSIPSRYDQRFEMGGMTVYASFKAKDVSINTELDQDIFGPAGK